MQWTHDPTLMPCCVQCPYILALLIDNFIVICKRSIDKAGLHVDCTARPLKVLDYGSTASYKSKGFEINSLFLFMIHNM